MWTRVDNLADDKQRTLEEALQEAEKLQKAINEMLKWLLDA